MAPIPSIDTQLLAARGTELVARGLAELDAHAHMLMKREVSHFTVETLAVCKFVHRRGGLGFENPYIC
jgi:hypothetical protein